MGLTRRDFLKGVGGWLLAIPVLGLSMALKPTVTAQSMVQPPEVNNLEGVEFVTVEAPEEGVGEYWFRELANETEKLVEHLSPWERAQLSHVDLSELRQTRRG